MRRQRTPICVVLALASTIVEGASAIAIAAGGSPYDPRLIVPIPILRRHACAADYSVPNRRGVAILSPVESPDHDCSVVGGKPLCVPYYPDYCTHGSHGPRLAIPDNGNGYCPGGACCPGGASGPGVIGTSTIPGGTPTSTYGLYSGANQNELILLHLGGNATADPQAQPRGGPADLIDLIETGQ